MSCVPLLLLSTQVAFALTVEIDVTPAYLQAQPGLFTVEAEKRDDGLIHFAFTRHLSAPRYLVSHFKLRPEGGPAFESHSATFVRDTYARYRLVVSPQQLGDASFVLSEHTFNMLDEAPIPVVGGKMYRFHLKSFPVAAPETEDP